MPAQDDNGGGAMAMPVSSGQTQPADISCPPSHQFTADDDKSAGFSDVLIHHDPADHHDDTSEPYSKSSKAKHSDTLRRSQACLACRKRKLRCDAKKPTCTRCEKAWLSYHPAADAAGSSKENPPPCEYDTSLLAKIFKRSSSNEPPAASSSQLPVLQYRDSVQNEQLAEENEQLRAQITFLQGQLRRHDDGLGPSATRESLAPPYRPQVASPATSPAAVHRLADPRHDDEPSHKRRRSPSDYNSPGDGSRNSIGTSAPLSLPPTIQHDERASATSQPPVTANTSNPGQSRLLPVIPSVFSWPESQQRQGLGTSPGTSWTPTPPYRSEAGTRPSAESSASTQARMPPLPSRQSMDRLVETCRHESWLFGCINGYALSDVAALLDSKPNVESDYLMARALMLATVAIGLPLLASAFPKGPASAATFQDIDESVRVQLNLDLPHLNSSAWLPLVTRLYADGARSLVNQAQTGSAALVTSATFVTRLLLVEAGHASSVIQSSQADLSSAASEARLLHLNSSAPDAQPRMSAGPSPSSHLARALRGLMQNKEESFSFWSLFLHDCFQSRLSSLPVTLERQSIRTALPRRTEVDNATLTKHDLSEVEAYMNRRRNLPLLESSDSSMSLLVKVGLVLDQCCEHAIRARQRDSFADAADGREVNLQQEELDKAFLAAHESIRNSRMMLSHFDDRTLSRSGVSSGGANSNRSRESLVSTLVLQDQLRFAAEVTHHLAVLSLFGTVMNVVDPFHQMSESRGMICNAAIWLSRLAGMALRDAPLLFALPSFCSSAFFVAARWLLFLQCADPEHFHEDFSTLLLVLSKRGERYARDNSLARCIVALKREGDFYGRVCISPFTWPVEAISEFIPIPRQDTLRGRPRPSPPQPAESGFVSLSNLAAAIDDAAVFNLANAPSTALG